VFLPFYLTTIGAALAASGDAEGARHRFEESLRLGAETGMRFYDAETMRLMAHLATDRDQVVSELREALNLARAQAARPFELRVALDLHDLLGEEARPMVEDAIHPFDGRAVTFDLEAARNRFAASA
jgi:hypothetical protein